MNYLKKKWEGLVLIFKAGVTPNKLALGIAGGVVIGAFPIIGPTTFLCFVYAWLTRVNIGIVQFANYITYPLQIICLIPLYKLGSYVSGVSFSEEAFKNINSISGFTGFIQQFGVVIFYTIGVWFAIGLLAGVVLYMVTYLIALKATTRLKKTIISTNSLPT